MEPQCTDRGVALKEITRCLRHTSHWMAGLAAHLIIWRLVSCRQAAPQLGWAVCSGEWHIKSWWMLTTRHWKHLSFWLADSFPPKAPEIIGLREQILCVLCKTPISYGLVSDLNRYRLSPIHSYSWSFLFPSNFSCFYFLLLFLFFLPKRLGKRWLEVGRHWTHKPVIMAVCYQAPLVPFVTPHIP